MLNVEHATDRLFEALKSKSSEFRKDAPPVDRDQARRVLSATLSGAPLEQVVDQLVAYRVSPETFLAAGGVSNASADSAVRFLATCDHIGLPAAESWRAVNAFPRYPQLKSAYGFTELIDCAAAGYSAEALQRHLATVIVTLEPTPWTLPTATGVLNSKM